MWPLRQQRGLESAAAQHRNHMNVHNTEPPDPRQFFWKSLGDQLEEWLDEGEEIISSGDFNEEVQNQQMQDFFSEHNMTERAVELVECSPETYKGNLLGKTMNRIWTTPGLLPISVGHTECLEEFDHRMVWVDFEEHEVFGYNENKSVPVVGRRCALGQVKLVNECPSNLKWLCDEMNMQGRLELAVQKFE